MLSFLLKRINQSEYEYMGSEFGKELMKLLMEEIKTNKIINSEKLPDIKHSLLR